MRRYCRILHGLQKSSVQDRLNFGAWCKVLVQSGQCSGHENHGILQSAAQTCSARDSSWIKLDLNRASGKGHASRNLACPKSGVPELLYAIYGRGWGFPECMPELLCPVKPKGGALLARSWRRWGAASRSGMEWPLRRSYRQAGAVVSRAGARNCTGGFWRGSGCRARVRVEGCVVGFFFGLGSAVWGVQSLVFGFLVFSGDGIVR